MLRATQDTVAFVPAGASFRRVQVKADQFVPEEWVGDPAGGPVAGVVELTEQELAVLQAPPASYRWQVDTTGEGWAGAEPVPPPVDPKLASIDPASFDLPLTMFTVNFTGEGLEFDDPAAVLGLVTKNPDGIRITSDSLTLTDDTSGTTELAGFQIDNTWTDCDFRLSTGPPDWTDLTNAVPIAFVEAPPPPVVVDTIAPVSSAVDAVGFSIAFTGSGFTAASVDAASIVSANQTWTESTSFNINSDTQCTAWFDGPGAGEEGVGYACLKLGGTPVGAAMTFEWTAAGGAAQEAEKKPPAKARKRE